VNRDDIINTSLNNYEQGARDILEIMIKKSITEVCTYIQQQGIDSNNNLYNVIWHRLLKKFDFCLALFYKCLQDIEICHDMWMPFQSIIMSISDFIQADKTFLPRREMSNERTYTVMQMLFLRLLESKEIGFRAVESPDNAVRRHR
jgi:hypothetical protein